MRIPHLPQAARTAVVAAAIGFGALGVAGLAHAAGPDIDATTAPVITAPSQPSARTVPQPQPRWDMYTVSDTAISGGSAVETVPADDLIISADGTGYSSYSDYVSGSNPYRQLPYGDGYSDDY
ncbi:MULTISPECIES: hypothetical protein [Rhodococcus]|uniref:hypothetical protein n=1 Tax=Rhodococcus TaxID=1827 RepID=UPI000C9B2842|nr:MULTISPECIES: hypothetical protein [Rhodococcus]PND53632.1 hypothetical protein CQZ88_02255 [Rhodococcus sp. ENV425]WKW98909.1 hypothetical protein Q3O43_00785 [Rhodococcus aetherivorans]